jgi:hypothetical protein
MKAEQLRIRNDRYWPEAAGRIFVVSRRFQGEADIDFQRASICSE